MFFFRKKKRKRVSCESIDFGYGDYDKREKLYYYTKPVIVNDLNKTLYIYIGSHIEDISQEQCVQYKWVCQNLQYLQNLSFEFLLFQEFDLGREDFSVVYSLDEITICEVGAEYDMEISFTNLQDGFTSLNVYFLNGDPVAFSVNG